VPRFTDKGVTADKVRFYRVLAIAADGTESRPSFTARTQPRVLVKPVVSVLATDKVEVSWNAHPAPDVVGYHVYRGLVTMRTVKKGTPGAWKDNDPEYAEPMPVEVRDITNIRRLTEHPLKATTFTDAVSLTKPDLAEGEYKYQVHAYIVRAVNKLG